MNSSQKIIVFALLFGVPLNCAQFCVPIAADTIWLKGRTEPSFGIVVEQSKNRILFEPYANEKMQIEIELQQIESLIVSIDRKRLESLDPANPETYRDYAEELALQKKDPTARRMAIRLFVIAAFHSTGELQQSCLAGLIPLAESEQQKQKWTTLRILNDPSFKLDSESRNEVDPITPEDRLLALKIVRLIRRGKGIMAVRLMGDAAGVQALQHWEDICSPTELKRIALLNRPSTDQLHLLLQVELSIIQGVEDDPDNRSGTRSWGDLAQTSSSMIGTIPNLKTATEFQPTESVYRNGRWQEPGN